MKANSTAKTGDTVKTYAVPLDVFMDILKILFEHKLPHRIAGFNVKENYIQLTVKFPADHLYGKETQKNIETIVSDYGFYFNDAPDSTFLGGNIYEGQNEF